MSNVASTTYYTPQQQPAASQVNMAENHQGPMVDAGSQGTAKPDDQVSLATSPITRKNLDVGQAIELGHTKLNLLIKGVGATNEELGRTAGQVSRMNVNLATIIKNNPPFPPDSEQRKELLMSYASIRQEIIKMTVPAPPPPVYEKVKGAWSSLFGQDGKILHYAVPELQATSSDSEVQYAAKSLDTTGETLANLSSGITRALVQP